MSIHRLLLVCSVFAVVSCSCEPGFELGEKHVVTLSGEQEYVDPVSGVTLLFDEPAHGTLVTAPIIRGPEAPFPGGQGLYIEYDGSGIVRARVEIDSEEEGVMYAYGIHPGSVDDGIDAFARWVPVAEDDVGSDSELQYDLPLTSPSETDSETDSLNSELARMFFPLSRRGSDHPGFSHFWINRLRPTSTDIERRTAQYYQVKQDIQYWIDALPEPLKSTAREEVDERLALRHYEDGNYYIGFTRWRLLGLRRTTPMMGLTLDADENTIAHEVGHYMSHVLAGDDLYFNLENTAPDADHGVGVLHPGRITVMEDYAYFSQFFLRGHVGSGDPTQPRAMLARLRPSRLDLPSVEGFGCVLLAGLVRTQPQIVGVVSGKDEDIPTVGANFGEVLSLIAMGASTIDELREVVELFLAGRGEADKLPVIGERIGWSYQARGRLLSGEADEDGNHPPISGASVRAIARVGSVEYDAGKAATTNRKGEFSLSRAFPSASILAFEDDDGEFEIPMNISWSRPTDEQVDLGDLYRPVMSCGGCDDGCSTTGDSGGALLGFLGLVFLIFGRRLVRPTMESRA